MDEATSALLVVVFGVLVLAALMFFLIPEPANTAYVAESPIDLAVLQFRNSSTWPGIEETVRSRTEAKLVNSNAIDVFSRSQLDALLIERALDASGPLDPSTAIEIGSLAGVSKLLTGSVYAVDTRSEETEVCVEWSATECVTRVPGFKHTARVLAQVEVIDVDTGRVERVLDLDGADTVSLPTETAFGGFDTLLADAASEIADELLTDLTRHYFRELRYGLYRAVEQKRGGYVGRGETDRFRSSDETAHLVVHFTMLEDRETFDVEWVTSNGTVIERTEDLVGDGDWRLYTLDLSALATGRYAVRAELGGRPAFREPFTVSR